MKCPDGGQLRHDGPCPPVSFLCAECGQEPVGDNEQDMCDGCYAWFCGDPSGDAYDKARDDWEREQGE